MNGKDAARLLYGGKDVTTLAERVAMRKFKRTFNAELLKHLQSFETIADAIAEVELWNAAIDEEERRDAEE